VNEPIVIRPQARLILSMHPYQLIEKNEDGTGGGIRLRVRGDDGPDAQFIEVIWGKTTEIQVVLP
jgi:hypothetical protein